MIGLLNSFLILCYISRATEMFVVYILFNMIAIELSRAIKSIVFIKYHLQF